MLKQRWLEESGQWLVNVYQTRLVLDSTTKALVREVSSLARHPLVKDQVSKTTKRGKLSKSTIHNNLRFFVVLRSGLCLLLYFRNPLHKHSMGSIYCPRSKQVKISQQCWDSNPVQLSEKCKCYLSALPPPGSKG